LRAVTLALAVAAAWLAVHLVAAAAIPLGADEAYYWMWSRHLAAGYFDHPPMIALLIRIGTALFGDSAFGIRFVPTLAGAATAGAVFLTGRLLFDETAAMRAVLLYSASLLFGVGGMLATPDLPAIFFWSLTVLAFAVVVATGRSAAWLAVGLFAGLGAASKYTCLFLGPGVLLALVLNRDLRRWLRSPWIWAGGGGALLAFAPVLAWNAAHDWASFGKQFGRIAGAGFRLAPLAEFVGTLIGLLNPLVAVLAIAAVRFAWRPGDDARRRAVATLLALVAPLLVYFLFHATHDRVQAQWPAPAYPTLALAAAGAIGAVGHGRIKRFLAVAARHALPFGATVSLAALAYTAMPVFPLPADPAAMLRGWREFASDADALRRASGATWIAPDAYQVTAVLTYYLDGSVPVAQFDERIRYAFAPQSEGPATAGPVLVITPAGRQPAELERCFADLRPVGTLSRRAPDGRVIETFPAYYASGPRGPLLSLGCDRMP
jgi:4-amino-4-deoxy-L-arabinose transferase-like glycosyltransferase